MSIKRFEDITSWIKSKELVLFVYNKLINNRDYGFKDQIQRASISIMNNIAEGFGRGSKNEFIYFLRISKGSCIEVNSMIYIAKDLNYINNEEFDYLRILLEEISKTLAGLIKYLNNKNK